MSVFSRKAASNGEWGAGIARALLLLPLLGLVLGGPLARPVASGEAIQASPERLSQVLNLLGRLPSGRKLLTRAQRFWGLSRREELPTVLRWGSSSRTDAVLTRHFDPETGREWRDRQVAIYLKSNQRLEDTLLDLAHELVHATARPSWDPYDPELTAGKYIHAAIEGSGGEVDAVVTECQVGFELSDRYGISSPSIRRCRGYLAEGSSRRGSVERDRVAKDFYRVGKWNAEILSWLRAERSQFPLLSPEEPKLYSSTGNAPYPVALFREFKEITEIACENSRKRVQAGPGRSPASQDAQAQAFLSKRCEAP